MKAFTIRAGLTKQERTLLEVGGFVAFVLIWQICSMLINKASILPPPLSVITCLPELHFQDLIIKNLSYSIYLNVMGYMIAILIAVPLGFMIGLYPFFDGISSRYIDAIRYLPLTAVTGLFMAWFGSGASMKILFLAFGILIYLVPVVVQRVQEVEEVYVQTAQTLGASQWQITKEVFIPYVLSKVYNDIRVLVAISWTYIIVAEMQNNEGGIGALIWLHAKQVHINKVFAELAIIILVGIVQDKIFIFGDKQLFKFKYANGGKK